MVQALPAAADQAAYMVASNTVHTVINQARDDDWGTTDDQVGFDFQLWVDTARPVDRIGQGYYGILSPERMGTAADFEKIAQSPQRGGIPRDELMWHTGRRMGDSFRRLIAERPANREALAELRQSVWGAKAPQWWFKNYGSYFAGSYPMAPGTFSIELGAVKARDEVGNIVSRTVSAYLRRERLLV